MANKFDEMYNELVSKRKDEAPKAYEFEFDIKGNFLSVSPGAAEFAGYTVEAIETMSVWDVVSEKDHDLMLSKFAARREGAPVDPYEVTLMTREGKAIRIRVVTTPVIENGKLARIKGRFTPV